MWRSGGRMRGGGRHRGIERWRRHGEVKGDIERQKGGGKKKRWRERY